MIKYLSLAVTNNHRYHQLIAGLYYCSFQFGSCYSQSDDGSSSRKESMCHLDIIKCFKMGALVEKRVWLSSYCGYWS